MKNNKLLVLLTTSLLMLSACGESNPQPGTSSVESPTSSETSQGGTSSQGDSSSQGGESSGGDSSSGSAQVQTDQLKTLAELQTNLGTYFMFQYNPTTDIMNPGQFKDDAEKVTWATDNRYTVQEELGYKKLWEKITGYNHQYSGLVNGKYTKLGNPLRFDEDPDLNNAVAAAVPLLMMHVNSIEYTSKENSTFLNRNVVKYTLEKELNGGQLTSNTIIDVQTGLTLRQYSSYRGDHAETLKTNFEVTLFTQTHSEVDTYLALETSKIGLRYWDQTFIESTGLTYTGLALPEGILYFTDYRHNDGDYHRQTIVWFITCTTLQAGMTSAKAFLASLYEKGAKYDYNGSMKSAYDDEDLYYEDLDDNEFTFTAYTSSSNEGGYIDVDGDTTSMNGVQYYRLEIDLYAPIA